VCRFASKVEVRRFTWGMSIIRIDLLNLGVKKFVQSVRQNRDDRLYHENSNKSATRTFGYLEKQKGPLKASNKKDCDDYAVGVLSDIRYAPWLYVYSTFAGQFREGWLPSNYWGRVIVPKIQGVHGRVSELKSMNKLIFRSDFFLTFRRMLTEYSLTIQGKYSRQTKQKLSVFVQFSCGFQA
jgi:hypothetical protein